MCTVVICCHPGRADGTGVNGADRSPDGTLLATADDFGQLNLHRYPCVQPEGRGKPPNRRSFGPGKDGAHASAALACKWASDEMLLSVGGLDLTLMQWRRKRA